MAAVYLYDRHDTWIRYTHLGHGILYPVVATATEYVPQDFHWGISHWRERTVTKPPAASDRPIYTMNRDVRRGHPFPAYSQKAYSRGIRQLEWTSQVIKLQIAGRLLSLRPRGPKVPPMYSRF